MFDADDWRTLHPGHHSVRFKQFDYTQRGFYFVTICRDGRRGVFGGIRDGKMEDSRLGALAKEFWVAIPFHFPRALLHEFVAMPNHVHGIIELADRKGWSEQEVEALPTSAGQRRVAAGSLGAIVRSFKATVTKRTHEELKWQGKVWQRSYFERVLRDAEEIANARRYILENPRKWEWDEENRAGIGRK